MHCPNCKKEYDPILERRKPGMLIQKEFPLATAEQREQLLTGICSTKCWNTFVGVKRK